MNDLSRPLDGAGNCEAHRRSADLLAPARHEDDSPPVSNTERSQPCQMGQSLRRPHEHNENQMDPVDAGSCVVSGVDLSHLPRDVNASIQHYRPQAMPLGEWSEIRAFVIRTIAMTQPPTVDAARKQLTVISRYVADQVHAGLPLEREILFTAPRVEQYLARTPRRDSVGSRTRGDYAARLRTLGRSLHPAGNWPPASTKGSSSSLLPPYDDDEYARIMAALDRLPDGPKRRAVITASHVFLGAGPTPGEAIKLLPSDVYCDHFSRTWLRITDGDGNARVVPIAGGHGPSLLEIANEIDGRLIGLGRGKNELATLLRATQLGSDTPPLSARRMRSTWMVHRARAGASWTSIRDAAGLTTLGFVRDLATFLPDQAADATNRALAQGVATFAVPRLSMTEPLDGFVE